MMTMNITNSTKIGIIDTCNNLPVDKETMIDLISPILKYQGISFIVSFIVSLILAYILISMIDKNSKVKNVKINIFVFFILNNIIIILLFLILSGIDLGFINNLFSSLK